MVAEFMEPPTAMVNPWGIGAIAPGYFHFTALLPSLPIYGVSLRPHGGGMTMKRAPMIPSAVDDYTGVTMIFR